MSIARGEEHCRLEVEPHCISPIGAVRAADRRIRQSPASPRRGVLLLIRLLSPSPVARTGPEPSPLGVLPEDLSPGSRARSRTRSHIECIFSVVLVAAIVALCHFGGLSVRYLQSHRNCEIGGLEGCFDLEEIFRKSEKFYTVCTYKRQCFSLRARRCCPRRPSSERVRVRPSCVPATNAAVDSCAYARVNSSCALRALARAKDGHEFFHESCTVTDSEVIDYND